MPHQYEVTSLPESINIPWADVPDSMAQLNAMCEKNETVYILCRRGNDSKEATNFLITKHGIKNVVNVQQGINGLSRLDPDFPLY